MDIKCEDTVKYVELTALLANKHHWRLKSIRIRWFNSNIFMGIFCLQTSSVANNQEIIISSAINVENVIYKKYFVL